MKPQRVQRKRTKGFGLQQASRSGLPVKYVGRPTKWGNPFRADVLGADEAVRRYRECLSNPPMVYVHLDELEATIQFNRFCWMKENLDQLRGYDLACSCPIDRPCHAEVLIEAIDL